MTRIAAAITALLLLGATRGAGAQTPPAPADWPTQGRFTIGADALAWWLKDSPTPVTVVEGAPLGETGSHTLVGGSGVSTGANTGFRVSTAYALGNGTALEGNYFYLGSRSQTDSVTSSGEAGSTNLLLSYVDAITQQETVTQLSLAPVYRGGAAQTVRNNLQGAELNGAWTLAPMGGWNIDVLGGVRYLRLRESWTLATESPYIEPFGNDVWQTTDQFDTSNHFYGVQAGARGRYDKGAWFGTATAKVALGTMKQSANVSGSLLTNDFTDYGANQTFAGGYFALGTNSGSYSRSTFAVVPELVFNVGYRITPAATVTVGYSFLYASNVARPGSQVNRTLNTSQSVAHTQDTGATLVGTAQPSFTFNDSSFWVQGVSIGLSLQF